MDVTDYVIITFVVEIIELFLYYSRNLKEYIFKIYSFYQKSIFLFFISNVGYLWILYIAIRHNNLNFAIVLAIILKSLDIFIKITLIDKIYIKEDKAYIESLSSIVEEKIPMGFYLVGVLTYPYIVYIALT